MEVTLRENSWHYRLNRWSLESDPNFWSLCPYFWLTLWHIFTFPFRVIGRYCILRPMEWLLVPRGQRSWETPAFTSAFEKPKPLSKAYRISIKLENIARKSIGYLILAACILIFGISIYMMIIKNEWLEVLVTFGFIIGLWVVLMAFVIGLVWLKSKITETDTWNALSGMAYSIKNKICPAINWKK